MRQRSLRRALRKAPPVAPMVVLLGAVLLPSGCNLTRYAIRKTGPVLGRTVSVLSAYKDPAMARQAAPALLVILEGLLASDPQNPLLLELLCRGIYEYTFGFLQADYARLRETDPDAAERARRRARGQYVKVYELGLRLLRTRGVEITLQRTPTAQIERTVAALDARAVPGLTWTAVGAGSAIALGLDKPWLLQMLGKIPVLLRRAATLDPTYANALPVAALGLYYGRDLTTGGSAVLAQRHFLRAIRLTARRHLLYLVLYARYWAWQFQSVRAERVGRGSGSRMVPLRPADKRALFVSLLQEVLRFPLDRAPELRLPNTLAQAMARRLIARKDDFLAATPPPGPGTTPDGDRP